MAHPFGVTRLRIPVIPQWHNPDGTLWERPTPPQRPKPHKQFEHLSATERPLSPKPAEKVKHPPETDCLPPPPKRQNPNRNIKYLPATERRLSSIPTRFVGKSFIDCEPEDDDENYESSSSSEDEVIVKPVVRGSISESFADQINAGSGPQASPDSQLQSTLREAVVSEERNLLEEQPLEQPDDVASDQSIDQPDEQPDEQAVDESIEQPNGATVNAPAEQPIVPKFDLDAEESTQEVYAAVDEILQEVCSSTRALPPSTSTDPPSRTDQLMTNPSSSELNDLVLEPVTEQHDAVTSDNEVGVLDEDQVMVEVGEEAVEEPLRTTSLGDVLEPVVKQAAAANSLGNIEYGEDESMAEVGEESGESDIDGMSTGSTSDAGSNIVVATNVPAGYQADDEDEDEEMQDVQPAQKTISNRPSSSLSSAPPSSQLIAFVDLRDQEVSTSQPKPIENNEHEVSSSQPNENDEPLDHLEKLLRSPKKAKKEPEVATLKHRTPKKNTGTKSPYFTPQKDKSTTRRVPAGTSIVPVPPLTSARFGIIQEKLWREPFWLLIAVTLLNKTTGRAAVPIFENIKKLFPTPERLADADREVLLEMVRPLGLHNARSKRLVDMAKAWVESPPTKGRAYRILNYPTRGDGRAKDVDDVVEEDMDICNGSLEIGHMPGCGPYAYDSWRMFCRDKLRGVAEDYDGKGAEEEANFEPEWKRVLPMDKELRACLRWMWMREGVVWDPVSGEKRAASEEELEMAKHGEMDIEDEGERKFAKLAVGVGGSSPVKGEDVEERDVAIFGKAARKKELAAISDDADDDEIVANDDESDEIVVNGRTLPRSSEADDESEDVEVVEPAPKKTRPNEDGEDKAIAVEPPTRRSTRRPIFDDTVLIRRSSLATTITSTNNTPQSKKSAPKPKPANKRRTLAVDLSDSDEIVVLSARKLTEEEKAEAEKKRKAQKAAEKAAKKKKMAPRASNAVPDDYYGQPDDEFDSEGNSPAAAAEKKKRKAAESSQPTRKRKADAGTTTSPPRKKRGNVVEDAPASEPATRSRRGGEAAAPAPTPKTDGVAATGPAKKSASKGSSTKNNAAPSARRARVRPYVPNDEEYYGKPDDEFDSEGNSPKTAAERKRNRRETRNATRQERAVESVEASQEVVEVDDEDDDEDEPGATPVLAPVVRTVPGRTAPPAGRVTRQAVPYEEYMENDSEPEAESKHPNAAPENKTKQTAPQPATRRKTLIQPATRRRTVTGPVPSAANHTPAPARTRPAPTPKSTAPHPSPASRRSRPQRRTILTAPSAQSSDNDFPRVADNEGGHPLVPMRDQMIMQGGGVSPPLRSDGKFLTAGQARARDQERREKERLRGLGVERETAILVE